MSDFFLRAHYRLLPVEGCSEPVSLCSPAISFSLQWELSSTVQLSFAQISIFIVLVFPYLVLLVFGVRCFVFWWFVGLGVGGLLGLVLGLFFGGDRLFLVALEVPASVLDVTSPANSRFEPDPPDTNNLPAPKQSFAQSVA